uniref:Uncharacterized protein n=1 Tax=Attheya septentrionalis TaxID=420275 RepID=A0A7S2U7T8_9STRA|mmetsp:Transcript_14078/g.25448  ORF Transcript_14078/g.25448 Transcript_14078/m.25448 type:complete len:331 (+) Transcript_14078:183-1175(+)
MSSSSVRSIPSGSIAPPDEFQQKMSLLGNRNGMFAESVFTWDDLPCSLHFSDADPSDSATAAMKVLHDQYLTATFGAKQGMYGAGGGGVHVLYLGSPPLTTEDDNEEKEGDSPPDITTLLQMMRLAEEYAPPKMQWMTTVDPLHQQLFPKSPSEIDEDEESVVSFEPFVNLLQGEIPTRNIGSVPYPPHVLVNWPFLSHPTNDNASNDDDEGRLKVFPRVLFLLPRFAQLHDGNCRRSNCPVATAFAEYERTFSETNNTDETTTATRMYWYQYQNSPEAHHVHMNEGVMVQESEGIAKEAGDIMESPVVCLFQLESTGEVLGLVQWDYRD